MQLAALLILAAEFKIDTAKSHLSVHVYKKGAAATFLHDHDMQPSDWTGTITYDPAKPESFAVHLSFKADSLHDQEAKLSAGDRAKVDASAKTDVLEAPKFPAIEFSSTKFTPSKEGALDGNVEGTLSLHGVTKTITVPVTATLDGATLHASGKVPVVQTDFGMKPIYKALGAIQVKDSVDVEFDVVANSGP